MRRPKPKRDRTAARQLAGEEEFRSLAESLESCAVLVLDGQGRVASCNASTQRILGYQSGEIIGRHLSCLYPAEEAASGQPARDLATATTAGRHQQEQRWARCGGALFWAQVTITALPDGARGARAFLVLTRDITEERRAGISSSIVELAVNSMIMDDGNGHIVLVNSQAEKLFGYPRHELVGQSIEMLVPERFRARHPEYRRAVFVAPTVRPMGAGRDLYGRRRDGSEFPVEIGLNPVQSEQGQFILASIVDITERQRADEKFRLAVESAPNAMVMVDQAGRITLTNLQTEKMFGFARAELLGQSIELLVPDRFRACHPQFRQAYYGNPVARSMGSGRDLYGRRKDGSEFPVEIGLNPIQTTEGLQVLSAIVDITERKQLEQQALEHLAELAHASRLTTVGEMVLGLTHEINQPLGAAANYARACVRLAKSGHATVAELADWMEKAAAENGRACEIISRVRDYVRKDSAPPVRVDVNEAVAYVSRLTGPGAWGGANPLNVIEPELDLAADLPCVWGVRVQVEQVLVNLVRNAIEAMSELPAAQRRLVIATSSDAGFVRVSVTDSGPGIAPAHLGRLFQPFVSTKSGGMGLGLSISRSIAAAHGGQLTVESAVGSGTRFTLTLPIAVEPAVH